MKSLSTFVCTLASLVILLGGLNSTSAKDDSHSPSFARDILPVLSDKCFVCHGPDAPDSDSLRLDSFEGATEDRGGYQAIAPEALSESEILTRIFNTDDPMPPEDAEKQLSEEEREMIQNWILAGGEYQKHWAFVTPQRPTPPDSDLEHTTPIDAFIVDQLRQQDIDFAPEAERSVLARRAALVLTGLPPEPEQLLRYLNDDREDAYEKLVDELLQSERFGEHQARYWLDAVRYGDTHGLHLDNRRGIFPYRDWVVRSLNNNLPLDQFITWQLAGDLLPEPTLEQLVATGFVRMNPSTAEGGAIPAEFQAKNNFDRTETLGTVLLGMTLTCARCHTHKYDPILQTEYYQLLAFFNSTAENAMDGNSYTYGPVIKAPVDQSHWDRWLALEVDVTDFLSQLRSDDNESLSAEQRNAIAGNSHKESLTLIAKADGPFAGTDWLPRADELLKQIAAEEEAGTTTLIARDLPQPRETRVLHRGEYDLPTGDSLAPAVPSVMGSFPSSAPRNRLGLAQWLTSRDHPLVARVVVNRIWQRTLGQPLVRTPEDFGLQGQQPTHPELLDWLAVELQESGWDLKHMLKLMVTSQTFKQSSAYRTDIDDPENRLYARASRYRMDAEMLRDVSIWASGRLDPRMGGEGVKPYQPAGMWLALAHPGSNTKQYVRDEGPKVFRRSLYVYWKRTSPHPMMTLFDAPDRESSCVRRSRTNTALQSLGLFNETQRVEMSRLFAQRLLTEKSSTDERLDMIYHLVASRAASEVEQSACEGLLEFMMKRYQDDTDAAAELIAIGDSPIDETMDTAELAAWTQVVITVLASDTALVIY